MKTNEPQLKVVLFQESAGGSTLWIASCLDLDLVAQGKTLDEVKDAFMQTLKGYVSHTSRWNVAFSEFNQMGAILAI